ncbi:type II toxin-antitoxin system RelE/ParE family toxin [bacterium]|nr:type II toxin-antitoxin system RelE/ParE family toxin [bacterium]
MDIQFRTSDLEKCYKKFKLGVRKWGDQVARKYVLRINTIRQTRDIAQLCKLPALRCHELHGRRKGQYAIKLTGFYRLIITNKGKQLEIIQIEEVSKHYDD